MPHSKSRPPKPAASGTGFGPQGQLSVLQNQPVANTGSSLCGLSLSQAALWPFLFEKRRATLPSGEQSVSASFHKAQSVAGSFL